MEHPEYVQLYGGILAKAASDHAEEEASVPNQASKPRRTRRKKMTPRSPSNDDEEKRGKRGRPRVEPLDQSAVEVKEPSINCPLILIVYSVVVHRLDSPSEPTGNAKKLRSPSWKIVSPTYSKLLTT